MAWLATIGADTADTFAASPRDTIVPSVARPSTGGARALASLSELGDLHALVMGEVIGEGGMGVVRAAEQVALGRKVAVKTLRPARQEPGAALDLLREAWITGALEHPNVVPVHALQLDGDLPSIVMKRIEGIEWSKLIGNAEEVARRFGAADLLTWNLGILLHVLNALRFAHKLGILHRDLKPGNVMIGDFGEVYLLDWGIAVSLRDDGTGRFPLASAASTLAGTPAYLAPEMLGRAGGPPLSERTDVYLVGAVLHEIIAGHPPHRGNNSLAVITSVLASRPELPASAPPELARICTRAMHAEPEQRFESADALRLALQHYLEHRGSELLTKRATERLEELRAQLTAGKEQTPESHDDIYRLFGACRYGFRDALAVWPDNEEASRGLIEAIEAVAAYELANGRAQAAVSLLGELTTPSPLLADARAAAAKQAKRVEELERMERQHDKRIGSRTRTFLTAMFGIAFTAVPLVFAMVPRMQHLSYQMHFVWAGVFLVLLFATAWWARESLQATHLNRQLTRSMWYLFLVQAAVALGAWKLGRPTEELYTWNVVLYATFAGMFSISVDLYMLPAAFAYLLTFLLFAGETTRILYASAACNALICALGVWRWRPASIKYTDEERVARGKAPRRS